MMALQVIDLEKNLKNLWFPKAFSIDPFSESALKNSATLVGAFYWKLISFG